MCYIYTMIFFISENRTSVKSRHDIQNYTCIAWNYLDLGIYF